MAAHRFRGRSFDPVPQFPGKSVNIATTSLVAILLFAASVTWHIFSTDRAANMGNQKITDDRVSQVISADQVRDATRDLQLQELKIWQTKMSEKIDMMLEIMKKSEERRSP